MNSPTDSFDEGFTVGIEEGRRQMRNEAVEACKKRARYDTVPSIGNWEAEACAAEIELIPLKKEPT